MPGFIEALEGEIAELERLLSINPTYVKLQQARGLLDTYLLTDGPPLTDVAVQQDRPRVTRPSLSGTSAVIVDFVRTFLRDRRLPVPTREIMEALAGAGIEVGGAIPQNNVSSLMSKSDDFISHGRSGWTLAGATEKAGDENPAKETSPALFEHRIAPVEPPIFPAAPGSGGGT